MSGFAKNYAATRRNAMGSLFGGGGGSSPKVAPVPEPPKLPPPTPMPITETSTEVDTAGREQRKSELRKFGRNQTVLAGADLGANQQQSAGQAVKKSILGG